MEVKDLSSSLVEQYIQGDEQDLTLQYLIFNVYPNHKINPNFFQSQPNPKLAVRYNA